MFILQIFLHTFHLYLLRNKDILIAFILLTGNFHVKFCCCVIVSMDKFEITTCTPDHIEEVYNILANAFYNEPSSANCTIGERMTMEQWHTFLTFFVPSVCNNGLSSIAIDKDTKKAAGCFISRDFHEPLPKEFDEFCGSITRLNHLIGVVDIIDQSFYEKHPEYKDKQMGKVKFL